MNILYQIRAILQQKARRWLTNSEIPEQEAALLEKGDLIADTDNCLNPAEFLARGNPSIPTEHYCLVWLN